MSTTRWPGLLAAAVLFATMLFATVLPSAKASELVIASEWADNAHAVVNTTVLATRSIQVGDSAYTVADLGVDVTLRGDVADTVSVVYEGGTMDDGTVVIVSHAPEFRIGEPFQVALTPADAELAALIGDRVSGPMYKVVGSNEGAVAIGEGGEADGVNDYVHLGHRWGSFPATY